MKLSLSLFLNLLMKVLSKINFFHGLILAVLVKGLFSGFTWSLSSVIIVGTVGLTVDKIYREIKLKSEGEDDSKQRIAALEASLEKVFKTAEELNKHSRILDLKDALRR